MIRICIRYFCSISEHGKLHILFVFVWDELPQFSWGQIVMNLTTPINLANLRSAYVQCVNVGQRILKESVCEIHIDIRTQTHRHTTNMRTHLNQAKQHTCTHSRADNFASIAVWVKALSGESGMRRVHLVKPTHSHPSGVSLTRTRIALFERYLMLPIGVYRHVAYYMRTLYVCFALWIRWEL